MRVNHEHRQTGTGEEDLFFGVSITSSGKRRENIGTNSANARVVKSSLEPLSSKSVRDIFVKVGQMTTKSSNSLTSHRAVGFLGVSTTSSGKSKEYGGTSGVEKHGLKAYACLNSNVCLKKENSSPRTPTCACMPWPRIQSGSSRMALPSPFGLFRNFVLVLLLWGRFVWDETCFTASKTASKRNKLDMRGNHEPAK
jgi:hypothetical protein